MKSLRTFTLAFCLCAPFVPAKTNTASMFLLNQKGISQLRAAFAYTALGTGITLSGIYLATSGIKKLFTQKENTLSFEQDYKKNRNLALAGCTTIIAGMTIALFAK